MFLESEVPLYLARGRLGSQDDVADSEPGGSYNDLRTFTRDDGLRVGWLNVLSWEGCLEGRRCSRDTYPES